MNRRDFFRSGCAQLLACAWLLDAFKNDATANAAAVAPAPPGSDEEPARGGRVGWARLATSDRHWRRHSRSDSDLAHFIRTQTSLNLDPTWYSVAPSDIDGLAQYPLIFSTDLAHVTAPAELANLAEYLSRGGFLLVDACINTKDVNPDPDAFLAANLAVFRRIAPGATIKPLPPDHPVYQRYFVMRQRPPHTFMNSVPDPAWAKHPLYGVATPERLLAIVSLSGLQCGWDRMVAPPGHAEDCMRMVVNIYVEAMTA